MNHKKEIESKFDETQLRQANQLLLIHSKNNKGLSTQRPLQPIKSNLHNSYNTSLIEDNLGENLDNNADHYHEYEDPQDYEIEPETVEIPTE